MTNMSPIHDPMHLHGHFFRVGGALRGSILGCLLSFGSLLPASPATTQDHPDEHVEKGSHHAGLHFLHPLIAESVSPDTKVRLDYAFLDFPGGGVEHSAAFEAEYAFHRTFSIEADVPYSFTEGQFDVTELALKFANYAFEEHGLLLGYGLGMGFPAAGSQTYELEPFFNAGLQRGRWELEAFARFGMPFDRETPEEAETDIGYNLSGLYKLSGRVQGLLELDGEAGLSGQAVGEEVLNLTPGLRIQPLGDRPFVIGLAASVPLTDDRGFDTRVGVSLFYHFHAR